MMHFDSNRTGRGNRQRLSKITGQETYGILLTRLTRLTSGRLAKGRTRRLTARVGGGGTGRDVGVVRFGGPKRGQRIV
jgi:hypothetical protein